MLFIVTLFLVRSPLLFNLQDLYKGHVSRSAHPFIAFSVLWSSVSCSLPAPFAIPLPIRLVWPHAYTCDSLGSQQRHFMVLLSIQFPLIPPLRCTLLVAAGPSAPIPMDNYNFDLPAAVQLPDKPHPVFLCRSFGQISSFPSSPRFVFYWHW